ncbi:MAG: glutathione S-transferase family protein [Acidobacteria bacterium]|nr:glutathione S-transferase family protein [Acidobacteriota bacterium]
MTVEQTRDARMVLWGCSTSRTLRAHWALAELELDYEHRPIGPRTGETQTDEFTRLNPRQKIPLLQDGDLVLAESAAIVNYLAAEYGQPDGLIPDAGTEARARYDQWSFFVMMELDAHTLYVIRKHRDLAYLYGEAPAAIQTASEGFAKQSAVAELEFADGREFLLGDRFTSVDILLGSCLDWAVAYGEPIGPRLSAYRDRLNSRPAYLHAVQANFFTRPELLPPSLRGEGATANLP